MDTLIQSSSVEKMDLVEEFKQYVVDIRQKEFLFCSKHGLFAHVESLAHFSNEYCIVDDDDEPVIDSFLYAKYSAGFDDMSTP